ncbi:MAG: hypothetical protein J0L62_04420 [Bacteroidetes bacterium]|nr:hypothetical protein [Bacteroidota bacterium]
MADLTWINVNIQMLEQIEKPSERDRFELTSLYMMKMDQISRKIREEELPDSCKLLFNDFESTALTAIKNLIQSDSPAQPD